MSQVKTLPVLPLRDIVVFPEMVAPLFVGRDKSVRALEMVEEGENEIMLVAQRDPSVDDPAVDDLYAIGTVATILQLLKLPDGTVKVLVEGQTRGRLLKLNDRGEYFDADVELVEVSDVSPDDVKALMRAVIDQFENYVKLNRKIQPDSVATITKITDPGKLADTVAAQLSVKLSDKQDLLEVTDAKERLERVFSQMEGEMGMLQMERKIKNRVKRQMEKTQREYYLNEQMKAIQRELGEQEGGERDEIAELEDKLRETPLSEEARAKAEREVEAATAQGFRVAFLGGVGAGVFHVAFYAGVFFEVAVDVFLGFAARDAELARQAEGAHAVDQAEVDGLGVAPFVVADVVEGLAPDFGGGGAVNVQVVFEGVEQALVAGQVGHDAQFDL